MAHVQTIEPTLDAHVGRQATPKVLNRIMATILSPGHGLAIALCAH